MIGVGFATRRHEDRMFNHTNDERGTASDVACVDLRSLPPGTELVVDTCNSRYRFVMLDASSWDAMVQGGRHFRQMTRARIDGSTFGGSLLKIGWIGVGLFVELSVRGKRIVTSPVRSINVEDSRVRSSGILR